MHEKNQDDHILALWKVIDPSRRRFRRWNVDLPAEIRFDGRACACIVRDLSPGGACVVYDDGELPAVGTEIVLRFEEYGSISSEVRYALDGALGIRFIQEPEEEVRLAHFLASLAPSRSPPRHPLRTAAIVESEGRARSAELIDVSETGARIRLNDSGGLAPSDQIALQVEGHGNLTAIVRRLGDGEIGIAFEPAEDAGTETASTLGRIRNWIRARAT